MSNDRVTRITATLWGALSVIAILFIADAAIASSHGEYVNGNRPPNIILIFTDDQGYQDIGCFGSKEINTPNLDQMAAEGRRFTSFYSAASICSPSRAALLTGCYPPRTGVTRVLFPRDDLGLSPDEFTFAEMLKERGYSTACMGKWHLGHHPKFLPTRQGFDYYFGIPYSNDMKIDPKADFAPDAILRQGATIEWIRSLPQSQQPPNRVPLMVNEQVTEYPVDQSQLTRRYTEQATEFIRANHKRPFLLYLPHTMPHIPLYASDDFRNKSRGGLYGDTIEEIDWSVGQILSCLKELEIDRNTLVIFTSDNGPWDLKNGHGGSAHPLRGYKFGTYEGGMRVPCIMRWPERIQKGSVTDEIASTIDLFPTFAHVAGVSLDERRVIDGHSIVSLMTREGAESPHDAFFYYKGQQLSAVRSGDWKVRVTPANPKNGTFKEVELYHLGDDLSESKNLVFEEPGLANRLWELGQSFDRKLRQNSRPIGTLTDTSNDD